IDEEDAAVVADAMAPAGKPELAADVARAERAAGMAAITMHRRPHSAVETPSIGTRGKRMRDYLCQGKRAARPGGLAGPFRVAVGDHCRGRPERGTWPQRCRIDRRRC